MKSGLFSLQKLFWFLEIILTVQMPLCHPTDGFWSYLLLSFIIHDYLLQVAWIMASGYPPANWNTTSWIMQICICHIFDVIISPGDVKADVHGLDYDLEKRVQQLASSTGEIVLSCLTINKATLLSCADYLWLLELGMHLKWVAERAEVLLGVTTACARRGDSWSASDSLLRMQCLKFPTEKHNREKIKTVVLRMGGKRLRPRK